MHHGYVRSGSGVYHPRRQPEPPRRHLPERWRYTAKQRMPKLRERAQERSDYSVLDWSGTKAFAYGDLLTLKDVRCKTILVPTDRLAYVELGPSAERRVGFATEE